MLDDTEENLKRAPYSAFVLLISLAGAGLIFGAPQSASKQHHVAQKEKESDPVKTYGSRGAPILMEVYSDYQCPSCRALFEQTLRPLIEDYVASGKVFLIHRDYPLPIHQYSWEAARYANAAARIGKFSEVEAALYDNQAAWTADGNVQKFVAAVLSDAEMKRIQKMLDPCGGPNATTRPASLSLSGNDGCVLDSFIQKDVASGQLLPVQQTPTSLVTYKGQPQPVVGFVSYPILKQFFDQLLKQ